MVDRVASNKEIGARLSLLLTALEISAAELCRQIDIQANRWSQYESGERRITVAVATRLKRKFAVTLDWIYVGDESGLPLRLAAKTRTAAE